MSTENRYAWEDFTPDESTDAVPGKEILTITDSDEEMAVIIHRHVATVHDDAIMDSKRRAAQRIVDALNARPITLYAAVVEWPEDLSDSEPALILTRTEADRDAQIIAVLRVMAEALVADDWREAIQEAEADEVTDWRTWLDYLEETEYGRPFVSTYKKEIPA